MYDILRIHMANVVQVTQHGLTIFCYYCINKIFYPMRLVFTILSLGLLCHLQAQKVDYAGSNCVDLPHELRQRLIANKKALQSGRAFPRESIYVPVKFHLAAESDGAGRIEVADVLNQLCALNKEFEASGFIFYINSGFNLINNTNVFENPTTATGVARMIRESREEGPNSLNIFITQNADRGSIENGTVLGFYSIQNDWIVIRKSQVGNGENTLAHEIGHYFSLNHPHIGWESDPWNKSDHGNPVLIRSINGVQIELVDKSNCESAGDMVCDTPPDYNFGLTWDTRCPEFDLDVADRNRDTIVPAQNNYMSYFLGCGPYEFSPQQNDIMMADYNSSLKSYLRTGYTPNLDPVTEKVALLSPNNNTTAEFYNGVELKWTASENATNYSILIRGGQDELAFQTQDTALYITELSPDRTYTWSVTPYNESSACAGKSTNILKTNDMTTATDDPIFSTEITLSPNPVYSGQIPRIAFESDTNLNGSLQVYDQSGRRIIQSNTMILTGYNEISIPLNDLTSGIYMLSLSTKKGSINRKVIINN